MTGKDIAIGAGAILLSGIILKSVTKKKPKRKASGVKTISFVDGGETTLKLPEGAEFVVTYDTLLPWVWSVQDNETVHMVEQGNGKVRFRFAGPLAENQPSQVYVQALGENNELLGEHKVTVFEKA